MDDVITDEAIQDLIKEQKFVKYKRTSAKTGQNVQALFKELSKSIHEESQKAPQTREPRKTLKLKREA